MFKTVKYKHTWWAPLSFSAIAIWHPLCIQWPEVEIEEAPCYSPNHEFYIKRVKSWIAYFYVKDADMFGVVRVYKKNGDPITSFRQENFDYEFGPVWHGKTLTYAVNDGTVIELPSEAGTHTEDKRCF